MNTFHHQCVATTGSRLRPTVLALDGVIEATERRDGRGFAAGLQWHNEMMWQHDERFLAPHPELAEACWEYAAERAAVPRCARLARHLEPPTIASRPSAKRTHALWVPS